MSWLSDFVENPGKAIETGVNNLSGGDIGGILGWNLGGGIPGILVGQQVGSAVGDALKPPDYSGPEAAAQKALDDEKKRRATEANRRDTQASQLARLFLSDNGAQDETFNFMGL